MNTVADELAFSAYLPRFDSLAIEQKFRASFLPQDRHLAIIIYVVSILIALTSMVPDALADLTFAERQGLHLSIFAFIFFNLVLIGNLVITTGYRRYDLIATCWWIGIISCWQTQLGEYRLIQRTQSTDGIETR